MQIILSKNWDLQLSAPSPVPAEESDDEGFFVGRKTEVELIKNDILNKNQGSILVAGHRGVGKTTLVYKAISEAAKEIKAGWKLKEGKDAESYQKKLNEKSETGNGVKIEKKSAKNSHKINLLFIPITAGQFCNTLKSQKVDLDPETIIKVIIRRLYASFKSAESRKIPMPKYIGELYNKAISKEYKLQESLGRLIKESTLIQREKKFRLDFKDIGKKEIIQLICFLAGAGCIFFTPFQQMIVNQIIGLIAAFPLPFGINAYISYLETKTRSEENTSNAELLYQIDNSLENLEYDLDDAHRRLSNEKWKIVYVIDELDKLGDIGNVSKVIKYFKNLFTLSKATFIFIGNEDIYKAARTEELIRQNAAVGADPVNDLPPEYRPEEYTYFSSKYFVSRPDWEELQTYLDQCIDKSNQCEPDMLKRVFHFLGHESGNDYFNLKNVIKDNIQGFNEEGNPILAINTETPETIRKSRFHKCQEVLYGKKYFKAQLGCHYDNETLFRELFKYSSLISMSPSKTEFKDPEKPDMPSAIKRDFNNFLAKLNVFSFTQEKILPINGVDFPLGKYIYNGYFKEDPPDQLNVLSEDETRFTSVFQDFISLIYPVLQDSLSVGKEEITGTALPSFIEKNPDLIKHIPVELLRPESGWLKMFSDLKKEPPELKLSREEVETGESKIKERIDIIGNSHFAITTQLIANRLGGDYTSTVTTSLEKYNSFVNFYGKEVIAAMEKKEMVYFYSDKENIDHFIVQPADKILTREFGHLFSFKLYVLGTDMSDHDWAKRPVSSFKIDSIWDCVDAAGSISHRITQTD